MVTVKVQESCCSHLAGPKHLAMQVWCKKTGLKDMTTCHGNVELIQTLNMDTFSAMPYSTWVELDTPVSAIALY